MKLTLLGDTHMRHDELGPLSGDVLIHCGDMFDLFQQQRRDLKQVDAWFSQQEFDLTLCIGGNHNRLLEERWSFTGQPFKHATYLEDQVWEHDGAVFYGTPWVPLLREHAVFANEAELAERRTRIPDTVDVLITHTSPAGILDRSSRGRQLECPHLAERVAVLAPSVH